MRYFFLILSFWVSSVFARSQEPYVPLLAQRYANQWVQDNAELRNPAYIYFSSDCTNFLSQSLRAGGFRDTTTGSQYSDLYWYYKSGTQYSQTWSLAHALYRRFANGYESWYGGYVVSPTTMRAKVGDIIFADWQGDSNIDHSMIVTGIGSSGEPLLSYHSTDRENYSWNTLLSKVLLPPPASVPRFYKYSKDQF